MLPTAGLPLAGMAMVVPGAATAAERNGGRGGRLRRLQRERQRWRRGGEGMATVAEVDEQADARARAILVPSMT